MRRVRVVGDSFQPEIVANPNKQSPIRKVHVPQRKDQVRAPSERKKAAPEEKLAPMSGALPRPPFKTAYARTDPDDLELAPHDDVDPGCRYGRAGSLH